MLITARWLLTGATPPLADAAVLVEGETIREIGTRRWFAKRDVADVVDLGESILLPGLVNAHCHLEHSIAPPSGARPELPAPISFSEWVRRLQEKSAPLSPAEREKGIRAGIQELIRGGTTTLVDHRSPEAGFFETPFREYVILEVLGASAERARTSAAEAKRRLQEMDIPCEISPHSLYAVHPSVLNDLPIRSIHLLESEEEDQFFRHGTGPLARLVKERGGEVPFPDVSPVRWLQARGAPPERPLIVHGNYLSNEEIGPLRDWEATVIHCPGSRRFFGHRLFPLEALVKADLPIALGTDSLASNDSLNMLREMKRMKGDFPSWGGEEILKMATSNGAAALGMGRETGTIEVGRQADLVAIPIWNGDLDPYEALLLPDEVNFSMVGGRILTPLS